MLKAKRDVIMQQYRQAGGRLPPTANPGEKELRQMLLYISRSNMWGGK